MSLPFRRRAKFTAILLALASINKARPLLFRWFRLMRATALLTAGIRALSNTVERNESSRLLEIPCGCASVGRQFVEGVNGAQLTICN